MAVKRSFFSILSQHVNVPALVTIALLLLLAGGLAGLSMAGYSGLSYSIAGSLPWILMLIAFMYCYIATNMWPAVIVASLLAAVNPITDRFDFPLQAETEVEVKDVDIVSGFLGINNRYRIETSSGVYMTAGDISARGQVIAVKKYSSADGFAQVTKLCSGAACVRAEALTPE